MLLPTGFIVKTAKTIRREKLTINTLERTTKISGLEFTETELKMMLEGLNQKLKNYQLRSIPLANFTVRPN